MEKKIRRTGKDSKAAQNSSEEKVIIVTILVAILIMGTILVALMVLEPIESEPFTAMYILDSDKRAEDYPKRVVLGENSTFTLWVGVENHNGTTLDYSVQYRLDDGTTTGGDSTARLVEVFNRTMADEETWEFPVTVVLDQLGSNTIVFQLHFFNATTNAWAPTGMEFYFSVEALQPENR